MKKTLSSLVFILCVIAFSFAQSQEQLWGIMNGDPVHVDLNGENFTRINGDTTSSGRHISEVHLGNDGYLYGTSTFGHTDTRLIYKIHKDSTVLHPVIKLKEGTMIISITLDANEVIFGSAVDQLTGLYFLFKVDTDGRNYRILRQFAEQQWLKEVVVDENYVYGIQGTGAGSGALAIFKISKADATYRVLGNVQGSPATPLLLTRENELVWVTSFPFNFNHKEVYKMNTDGSDFRFLNYFFTESPDINSLIQTREGKIFGAYSAAGYYPPTRYIFRLDTNHYGFAEQIQIQDNSWVPGGSFRELPDGRLISESAHTGLMLFFSPGDGSQQYRLSGNLRHLRDVGPDGKVYGVGGDFSVHADQTILYSANIDGSGFKIMQTFGTDEVGSLTSSLVPAPDGNFYGINNLGGANGRGTVFKIGPDGISKVFDNGELKVDWLYPNTDGYLYSHNYFMPGCNSLTLFRFKASGGGTEKACVPLKPFSSSGPVQLSTGEMVGVSRVGVENGFMYRFKPNLGGVEVLRSFNRESGKQPVTIMEGSNGYLYGIHFSGGAYNLGGIFRVKPDGSDYRLLIQFDGKNGWATSTNLAQHQDGTLYGVVPSYAKKKGFIFSVKPDGSDYKVAVDFTSPELTGISPSESLLMDSSGRLYNRGSRDGEVFIYRINTQGEGFQKIVSGWMDLAFISKSLAPAQVKVIQPADRAVDLPVKITFQVTPVAYAETYTLQLSNRSDFSTIQHAGTSSSPSIEVAGLNYGTTYYARVRTNLWPAFGPVTRFRTKTAELRLWGVTSTGGIGSNGTIFSIDINGTSFIKYHDYADPGGAALHDKLIPLDDGETLIGYSVPPKEVSTTSPGDIFTLKVDGTDFQLIKTDGLSYGGLMKTSDESFYYTDSWANRLGSVFSFDPESENWTSQYAFKRTDGTNPLSALLEHDGYLYGMASRGGYDNNGNGAMYRLRLNDHTFEKIHDFNKPMGKSPEGSLIDGTNGFLYGMTTSGGAANYGSIFRVKPDGSEFKKLHDFTNANGRMPLGDLLLYGGRLYGMTALGGKFKQGIIFRINRDGSGYIIQHHFSGSDGAQPLKNLIAYKGYLYGMTSKGGISGLGVIFKIKTDGTEFKKLFDFNAGTGGAPDGSLALIPTPVPAATRIAGSALAKVTNEVSQQQVFVQAYPNPFVDVLYLNITGTGDQEFQSTLMDISGRIVSSTTGLADTNAAIRTNISPGVYVLKVTVGNWTKYLRVVRK
jgi:uncharacterized repeat protein (TIGR03803 family)